MGNSAKCAVLVPVFENMKPKTEAMLKELSKRPDYEVRFLMGCSDIVLARSLMASDALAEGFEETMWIDSDVNFHPDDVDKLRSHNLPYAVGLYLRKGVPLFASTFFPEPKKVTFGTGGGLVPIKYASMGFTCVKAEVYDAVQAHRRIPRCARGVGNKTYVPYFLPTVIREDDHWDYLGEDLAFCHTARQAGYHPQADTTIKLGHLDGRYEWGWEDLVPHEKIASMTLEVSAVTPSIN